MIKIQGNDLHQVNKWQNVHHYRYISLPFFTLFPQSLLNILCCRCIKAPCTNVVYQSPEIASVGEDGKLNIMRANQEKPHRVIGNK